MTRLLRFVSSRVSRDDDDERLTTVSSSSGLGGGSDQKNAAATKIAFLDFYQYNREFFRKKRHMNTYLARMQSKAAERRVLCDDSGY